MLSIFESIILSSSVSLEDIELIPNINLDFQLSDFLRLFMISFKYGLISLRYSSIDSILFLSKLLPYLIYLIQYKLSALSGL